MRYFPLVFLYVLLASCATHKPVAFDGGQPPLDPIRFLQGHVKSYGVREARSGKPTMVTTTDIVGTLKDGVLYLEQDLFTEKGGKNHRSWQLRQLDAHHIEATADDIKGKTVGELYGNYFTWHYKLKVANSGLIKTVTMSQYMYLLPDGQTLVIRSVIRKFGVIVQEITEGFRRVD